MEGEVCSYPGVDVGWVWIEFVVGSLPYSEKFSGFALSLKTNTFKFQSDLERTDTFQRVLMNS